MKRYTFSTLLLSLTLTCFNPINQQVFGQKTTINTGKSLQITENALTTILEKNRANYKEGKVADYIPELGKMKADKIAFSVVDENGKVINVGDVNQKFTIQSISKIIALMIAVSEKGEENVFSKMGYYGTNMPFNHFANLETTGKPLNPMMNAGAILTTSMIDGEGEIPFQKILKNF